MLLQMLFFRVADRFQNLVKTTITKKGKKNWHASTKSFYYVSCSYYIANVSCTFMGSFYVLIVSGFPRNIYAGTTTFFQVADQFLNLVREKEKKERKNCHAPTKSFNYVSCSYYSSNISFTILLMYRCDGNRVVCPSFRDHHGCDSHLLTDAVDSLFFRCCCCLFCFFFTTGFVAGLLSVL